MAKTTINQAEISQFRSIAEQWWDYEGKFKPLHDMTPHRIEYIVQCVIPAQAGIQETKTRSDIINDDASHNHSLDSRLRGNDKLNGLTVLDVGCGGGLTAEPLTRLGAQVTGLDAENTTIEIAKAHATEMGLEINYLNTSVEEHALGGKTYDVVLALEIIEHVDNVPLFCEQLKAMLKPGGTLILSTLNRTLMSYTKAIVGAEYILRWVPRGTHDWQKFVKPSEMVNQFEEFGLKLHSLQGLSYNPLGRKWSLTDDLSVNYFACFKG